MAPRAGLPEERKCLAIRIGSTKRGSRGDQTGFSGRRVTYLLWASPLALVVAVLASRRGTSLTAGLAGLLLACLVAWTAAPTLLSGPGLVHAPGKGLWLSWLIGAVILGGLFFRTAVSRPGTEADPDSGLVTDERLRRQRAFAACFLIGPFSETATGFGVGQMTTIAILMHLGLSPLHVATLGLFSQILVPWGAMANGTMVGAVFSGLTPQALGVWSAVVSVPLVLGWLVLFWWFAGRAGLESGRKHQLTELGWIAAMLAALILANQGLGPETAALAALGPLIVLQFWRDERPSRGHWLSLLPVALPYAFLILALALTRAVPALNDVLREAIELRPIDGMIGWFPLLHPGSWLLAVGLLYLLLLRRAGAVPRIAATTWRQGWRAIVTIGSFLVMAQVMADSGTAQSLADGLVLALGAGALVATPLLAGVFGFVTGSSNATNALLMTSQVNLSAQHGVSPLWIAAIQNVAAAALTMLSPARVSMGCALTGEKKLEGQIYARAWSLGIVPILLLMLLCGALLLQRP